MAAESGTPAETCARAVPSALRASRCDPFPVIFVIGGPGMGKTTVAEELAAVMGGIRINIGDIIRERKLLQTPVEGPATASIYIGSREICSLVADRIREAARLSPLAKVFILDGFPMRPKDLIHWLLTASRTGGRREFVSVCAVKVVTPPEVCLLRCAQRNRRDYSASRTLNYYNNYLKYAGRIASVLNFFDVHVVVVNNIDFGGMTERVRMVSMTL